MASKTTEPNASHRKLTDPYSTGILSKDLPTELARLHALERWADPTSRALIQQFSIRADWRCLEMGAGAGSMAYWMAEQCPKGHVIAADIDPRYIDARRAPNLEIAQVDLTQHDFPKGSFDLIHTRLVLSHIPQRDEILRRAIEWLKPGGSVVVEDYYVLPLEQFSHEAFKLVFGAFVRSLEDQGSDSHWVRGVPSSLARLGIGDLRLVTTPLVVGIGDPSEKVWDLGFEQFGPLLVEKGFLSPEQAAAYRALSRSGAVDIPWLLLSASGRRLG